MSDDAGPRPPRNIVLCLDGTGNQLRPGRNTNVVELFKMLDLSDPAQQVGFYDPGVGTFSAQGAWSRAGKTWTRLLGLAFGFGIRQNLGEAYGFLMHHYRPGDRVFVFGFSRGAYTARALVGMSYRAGLMKPGAENLVDYLVRAYTKGDDFTDEDWRTMDEFADTFSWAHRRGSRTSRALPIHFLGLWDSVKALGWFRWDPRWPYTRQVPNAATIRHAVSLDEQRRPYAPYEVHLRDGSESDLQEVWFAGVHSDVGGGFAADAEAAEERDRRLLSTVTLKWMTDAAIDAGILLRTRAYGKRCAVDELDALAPVHRMGGWWRLLGTRRRRREPSAPLHHSVAVRTRELGYAPDPPPQGDWADEDWLTPHPAAP